MKNLLFKIKWVLLYRFFCKKRGAIAIIVENFTGDNVGEYALTLYKKFRDEGKEAYILCAFNNAPLGNSLYDIRHIFIFNNSPENLIEFCYKKGVTHFCYVNKQMLSGAVRAFGISSENITL